MFQKLDLSQLDSIPQFFKSPEQIGEIVPILKSIFLTKNLEAKELDKLAGAMRPEKYDPGKEIIRYGDEGNAYYILSKGTVKVIVYKKGTDPYDPQLAEKVQFQKELPKGSGFGELALINNDKRSATIQAVTACEAYSLDSVAFKALVIKSSILKRQQRTKFLNSIKLFDQIDKFQKLKLIDGLKSVEMKQSEFIFHQGDEGHEFYIIEQGEVECLLNDEKCVRILAQPDHFGELALINNEKRSLGIRVKSEICKLLSLDRETFERLLGNIH